MFWLQIREILFRNKQPVEFNIKFVILNECFAYFIIPLYGIKMRKTSLDM